MILNSNLGASKVRITPLVEQGKEKVSVDLSVGSLYRRSEDTDWLTINGSIVLQPNSCVIIQTKETINMPNDVFGFLSTRGSIGAKGIITANTKLDPLFNGELNIPVFNVSGRKVELKKGQAFCSMSFWRTEAPIVGEARHAINIQPVTEGRASSFWNRYSVQIVASVLTFIVSVAASLTTFFILGA